MRPWKKTFRGSRRRFVIWFFQAISALSTDPLPTGCKKLKGPKNRFRLKVARAYRVAYSLYKDERRITIEFVGHRKDAYRWF